MPATALALLVLSGIALYLMTPEEREQLAQAAVAAIKRAIRSAAQGSSGEPFHDVLRTRTGFPLVTPALVALNTLAFMVMLFGPGALNDVQTLVNWGANYAPRTTNGEWWRLIATTFVHAGMLHLFATIAGLVPLGLILERAVGRVTFATMYIAAGIAASVVSLWTTSPLSVSVGASGAIFGIYGLLLASLIWGVFSPPDVPIPVLTVKRIAAAAGVFFLYNLLTDDVGTASELAGLATGFLGGLVVARGVTREKPPVRRAAFAMAATIGIAVLCAVPLRGIVDVRPELARITAVEERTAGTYDAAVAKFRHRRITAEALIELINRTIMPELQAARARLKALSGVPREQLPLVAAAETYFELRELSWRRRAEGLLKSNLDKLREAEQTERAALGAFERMRPAS
jgi:membrane associated rhomboid family serine protease